MSEDRSIELEVEVNGSPEEVWAAIATGPGISSWYVPHTVEEREGGAMTASFGPGPEMQVAGRVAAWDPPNRILFDGGEDVEGMAFEWLIDAQDGGTCIVRLINTGFGTGAEWDAQYNGMAEGWRMFLFNLGQHLDHFGGDTATAMLASAAWDATQGNAWLRLKEALGVPPVPAVGDRVEVAGAPPLAGIVVDTHPHRIALLLMEPAAGTGFLAVEGRGDQVEVSVWLYLYGPDASAVAEHDDPRWRKWLAEIAP